MLTPMLPPMPRVVALHTCCSGKLKIKLNVCFFLLVADDDLVMTTDNSQMLPLVMNWIRQQMVSSKSTIDRLTEDVSIFDIHIW